MTIRTMVPGWMAMAMAVGTARSAPARQGVDSPGDSWEQPTAPLFATHELVELILEADFTQLKKDRGEDPEERPATLRWRAAHGSQRSLDLKVRTRGRYRLDMCDFPPLRLNFRKRSTKGTQFESQDKLKVVTHCEGRRPEYEQYLLQEYLVYRTYNLLTPMSFGVRLGRVTYVDREDGLDSLTRYAFFIEDEDDLAARNGSAVLDTAGVHQAEIDFDVATLFAVFQYFIGNTDWSVSAGHNVVLMRGEHGMPIAVPFDFDWSGVIATRYARPPPGAPITDVKQRLFISPCVNRYDLDPVFARFTEARGAIYDLYRSQTGLEEKRRRRSLQYYDEFYKTIARPKSVDREFIRGCA